MGVSLRLKRKLVAHADASAESPLGRFREDEDEAALSSRGDCGDIGPGERSIGLSDDYFCGTMGEVDDSRCALTRRRDFVFFFKKRSL